MEIQIKTHPVDVAMDVIGGKWKIRILYQLIDNPKRFGELRKRLSNITQQMLTVQLRELEKDGVIHREVYNQIPPKVEYSLTEFGRSLTPVINAICEWGTNNMTTIQALRSTAAND